MKCCFSNQKSQGIKERKIFIFKKVFPRQIQVHEFTRKIV